jgi:hypothetical protein
MALSVKSKQRIIKIFEQISWALKRKAGRKGTRLGVVATRLTKAFPGDRIFRMLNVAGDYLARRTDNLALSTGPHGTVKVPLSDLNRASKAWLIAFFGPARGTKFGREALEELEGTTADFVLESHHVVPMELAERYKAELAAFVTEIGKPPNIDAMITCAIPAGLHRGARYYPLELKSPRLAKLRKSLPSRGYNLTDSLRTEFSVAKVANMPFDEYLTKLSAFYRKELPELYREVALPGGGKGGIREALLQVADAYDKTPISAGNSRKLIAPNPP